MRRLWTCSLLLLVAGIALADIPSPDLDDMRLLRMPDIHGDTVVFVYAGDLWTVGSTGGEARRLTSSVGQETYPRFSPDGRWIAFSGEYDGNNDVYIMPTRGGEPRRLTYHPGADRVIDWEPDGKSVRFQSFRETAAGGRKLFTIGIEGGLPETMVLPSGGLSSWSDDGKRLAYNRITREHRTWKRYKGGMAQDVWIHDFERNHTRQITDWVGTDNFPMWQGDTIWYCSDRDDDRLNIWAWNEATDQHTQITDHDKYDVKYPSLGPDAVVYEHGGWLYTLDLTQTRPRPQRLKVSLRSDNVWSRPAWRSVDRWLRSADLGPDGQRAVVQARGDIYTIPAEKGPVRNLTATPDVREREAVWSPDGKSIAYLSDETGEYEVYLRPADGSGEPHRLTRGLGIWAYTMQWSPDSKHLLLSNAALELVLIDAEDGGHEVIDRSEQNPIRMADWSPHSDWVVYARTELNGYNSLKLYNLESGEIHQVTDDFTDETWPCFDDEGKYLFFASAQHFNPTIGGFDLKPKWFNMDGLYLVTLREDVEHPFPPESDEVEVAEDDADDSDDEGDKKDEENGDDEDADEDAEERLEIDLDGLADRMVALDVPSSSYFGLQFTGGKLFYLERPTATGGQPGPVVTTLKLFDMEEREEKTVMADVNGYTLSADGKKLMYRKNGQMGIVSAAADQKPAKTPLRLSDMKANIDPRQEWGQMLREAWRLERDYFYDPDMHQVDWDKMWDRYSELLPYIAHGSDFTYVVGEMISELNVGHAYARPGDQPRAENVGTGLLGCDFEADGDRYRFARIFDERDWNGGPDTPLFGPGREVAAGEYLLAVNGVELKAPMNPYSLLVDRIGQPVALTVGPKKNGDDSREVIVEPIRSEAGLRYHAWVEENRRKVDELSGGKIGYLHLPDTFFGGQRGFARGYYPQLRKEGLIIDERFNGGGFIPDFFMNILRQKLVNMWRPRHGADAWTPGTAFLGHLAMLSNGYAGSGGDALPYYFKAYELGPVIGTRTWGGLVGISRTIPLMGGGNVTFPEFGIYSLDGEWVVENHGVDPTIEVDNLPHEMIEGRDPQLEKAVEVLLEKITTEPVVVPTIRSFPRDRN